MTFLDKEHIYIFEDILHLFDLLDNLQDNMVFMPDKMYVYPNIVRENDGWELKVMFSNQPILEENYE